MFDIVILLGPNDVNIIEKQIEYTKKNIIGYRNIHIVTTNNIIKNLENRIPFNNCIFIDENIFPFSINDVAILHGKSHRNAWYLQQLLKLYSGIVIPNILDKFLVIDADTFFLKPTTFIEDDKCLYNYNIYEDKESYFIHMKKLYSGLEKMIADKSGICHHMIFENIYLLELFKIVEEEHQQPFWKVFLEKVEPDEYLRSGASEYEIYFNYMIKYHSDKIIIRKLNWENINHFQFNEYDDYVSVHWYTIRREPASKQNTKKPHFLQKLQFTR